MASSYSSANNEHNSVHHLSCYNETLSFFPNLQGKLVQDTPFYKGDTFQKSKGI